MKIKNILLISFILSAFLCASAVGQARMPHSLYFMETVPQTLQMNPAHQPRANVYVALPVNFGVDLHMDIAAKDILQKRGNQYHLLVEEQYDYNKLWKSIGKKATMINIGMDADIIGFGFRLKNNGYFSFGVSEHVSVKFALPSDFFKIFENFFPDKTRLDFSPMRCEGAAYLQFRLGYSHKVNDKLTVGLNVKPILGQVAAMAKFDKFDLNTGVDKWYLDGKGKFYASMPYKPVKNEDGYVDDFEPIDGFDFNNADVMDLVDKYLLGFNNIGVAFDLGAVYQINRRLSVSAALNNIGLSSWNEDMNGVKFNGRYTFDGFEFNTGADESLKDQSNKLGDEFGDNILDSLKFDTFRGKFITSPPPVLFAGASYNLTPALSLGLLSRTTFWKNGVRQSFNLSANLQPYSFVALTTGATWQVKGNVYLGGGLTFFVGPLQIYTLVDNVPAYYSTLTLNDKRVEFNENFPLPIPERLKTLTLRLGVNLVFGKHGYINKPMLNKGTSSWN